MSKLSLFTRNPMGSTRCWLPRDPGFDSETTMMTWGILGIAPFFSETTKWWWGVSRYFNVILCKYKIPVKSPRNLIESPFWLDKSSEITRVQHRSTSRAAASAIPTRVVAWEKRQNSPAVVGWGLGVNIIYIKMTSTWIWLVVSNIFFHNIWDNSSHWLIFFKMVKTTDQTSTWMLSRWLN